MGGKNGNDIYDIKDCSYYFGIIGTGLTSILSLTAVGTYGVPILVVSGIILGSIAMVKNTDAEQKNEDVQGYYVQYWVLFSIL